MSNFLLQNRFTLQFENLVHSSIKNTLETMLNKITNVIEHKKNEFTYSQMSITFSIWKTCFSQIGDLRISRDRHIKGEIPSQKKLSSLWMYTIRYEYS
ncbi:hypothetical protein CULT_1620002 [[Clostridium] ultunense Esp]|nr:hypothetical protein CULT_1620002 [[Clostridium] ultunense Esp]